MLKHIEKTHIDCFSEGYKILLWQFFVPNYIIYTCTQQYINNSWHLMSAYFVSGTELRILLELFH